MNKIAISPTGLIEEIFNSLARINELQVAGRTSALSFIRMNDRTGTP